MMKIRTFLIALFFVQFSFAEKFELKSDSTIYAIGDHAEFVLSYEGNENFTWPNLNDTLSKDLEIIKKEKIDTLRPGKYQQIIYITAWDSGYFTVPPIKSENAETDPFLLRFNTPDVDLQKDIKPIKEQMKTPFIFAEIKDLIFWTLLILGILTAIVALIIYYVKKNKHQEHTKTTIPTRPIMEVLWERYYALEKSKIWENGGEKEFQFELSLILRSFLEFKYKTRALEETTKNIITQLNSIGLNQKVKEDVSLILNFSDMVKFAKQKGVYAQHENALNILKETLETHTEDIE